MPPWFRNSCIVALTTLIGVWKVGAAIVQFSSVETTFHAGAALDLTRTIDGIEASPTGWSVAPQIDRHQAAVFRVSRPLVDADFINITLYFFSGQPRSSIAEWSLSITDDKTPSLQGHWEPCTIVRFSASDSQLKLTPDGHFHLPEMGDYISGSIRDMTYSVTIRTMRKTVTGFRLDAFPLRRSSGDTSLRLAYSHNGDFVLTEFHADTVSATTTNSALGARVTASHPLFPYQLPESLTDGLPSTFAHPNARDLGSSFYFEIDLGSVMTMDHIALRQRGDGRELNRFGRMRLLFFDQNPSFGARPVWNALHRADGSYPVNAQVDLLYATAGTGEFHGRYIRISSESKVPCSPQIAEVEVYARRTPMVASFRADGHDLAATKATVPAGMHRLAIQLKMSQPGSPLDIVFRWRLLGFDSEWHMSRDLAIDISCPQPGSYVFEAQAAHSDGLWDNSILSVPLKFRALFVQTLAFRVLMVGVALVAGLLVARHFNQRTIASLEAQNALAAERTRIARDMHDEVGARLSQLTFLLNAFVREHSLPESAQYDLQLITETSTRAISSLDEVVWTVNPKNDTLTSMADFLTYYAGSYLAPAGIACRIMAPIDWPAVQIRAQIRHELVFAFKEALHNVVKHSKAATVNLTLDYEPGRFVIIVADDGCGIPEQTQGFGKDGIANMKARLGSIGGSCNLKARPGGGLEVEMRLTLFA